MGCPTWCGADHALDRAGALPRHSRMVALLPGEVRVGVVWTPDLSTAFARRVLITAPRPGRPQNSPHVMALDLDSAAAFAAVLRALAPAARPSAAARGEGDRIDRLAAALTKAADLLSIDSLYAGPAADGGPDRPEPRKARP